MPAPLLVVDTPHLLYRAFHALPASITGADGRPVNALLGSVNLLLAAVELYAPRAVVCCFGQESATYRTELYPPYHAHRPPMPDPLAEQWERCGALYEAFGWIVMGSEDLEADDLLGSLAAAETAAGGETLILTGDRDMFQCADERVRVLLPGPKGRPVEVGPDEVRERYGIDPEAVPDFIALRGDPSDGLPGAKGIGEKTAAELLRRHGTLEGAIAAAVREKPSVRRALLEQSEELLRFKEIATLRHVELDRPADAPTDTEGGARAAEALGLNRLAARLRDARSA